MIFWRKIAPKIGILPFFKEVLGFIQIYVRAGLDKFGPTQPLTTNLCLDLLSFFNFLLSLQLLA